MYHRAARFTAASLLFTAIALGAPALLTPAEAALLAADDAAFATFGASSHGSPAALPANTKRVSPYVLGDAGTVTELAAYLDGKGRGKGRSQALRLVLYGDRKGAPRRLLAATKTYRVKRGAAARWVWLPVTREVQLAAGRYHLGIHSGAGAGVVRYGLVGSSAGRRVNRDPFATGPTGLFGRATAATGTVAAQGKVKRDKEAPSTPQGLTASAATHTSVGLVWTASTDNVGVAGYRIVVDGTAHGTTTGTSYTVTGLACGTGYHFEVEAFDASKNVSRRSSLAASTLACAEPPANTSAPSVGGQAVEGSSLAASAGSWSGSPTSYGYQWRRCDAAGAGCADIGGATSSAYVLGAPDVGATLRVAVTASNAAGSTTAVSAQTGVVGAQPDCPVGQLRTRFFDNRTMTGSAVLSRCDAAVDWNWGTGSPGAGVPADNFSAVVAGKVHADATGTHTFSVTADDGIRLYVDGALVIDRWLEQGATTYTAERHLAAGAHDVRIEYYEAGGLAVLRYSVAANTPAAAPTNSGLPTVTGQAVEGWTLTGGPGTWTGSPTSYAYQWRRCDGAGASCANVAGATGSSHTLGTADVGATLRVVVTASNAGGSSSATSAPTPVVQAAPTTPPGDGTLERWSNPATWGGQLPAAGSVVTIPAGKRVLLDTDAPRLDGLSVHGELHFQDRPTTLRSKYVLVYGRLVAGTTAAPLQSKVTISLEGETAPVVRSVAGFDIGANVMAAANGGTIELHGKDSGRMWTKLAQTAPAGATTIHLLEPVQWQPGDRIVLSSTDVDWRRYDEATVAGRSADGKTITLAAPLAHQHASVVTTFTQGSETRSVAERGDVGLLTKNLVVTGDPDPTRRFSGHTMVLPNSVMRLSNVEFAHLGQEGVLGRYPLHWHFTGDAGASYARNVSIHHTFSRFLTIHRANNMAVDGGVWHDSVGHGFMLEDGVEVGNKVNNVLAMTVRRPPDTKRLRKSDRSPSIFWVTHPSNDFTNIVAAGSEGSGVWYDFNWNSDNTGIATANRAPMGKLQNVEAHSHVNADGGTMGGATAGVGITVDGYYGNVRAHGYPDDRRVSNLLAWKNESFGLWLDGPYVARDVYAANNGTALNTQDNSVAGGLLVHTTANTGDQEPRLYGLVRFYHGEGDVDDLWLANFGRTATSAPDKTAITDRVMSSNQVTHRLRNVKFIGSGFRVYYANRCCQNPHSGNVGATHWFEDLDGSVRGDGVHALIGNRDPFIRRSDEVVLYPQAGTGFVSGHDFGGWSPKGNRVFGSLIADYHTFSMTRVSDGQTATSVHHAGLEFGHRYRINGGLPANVDLRIRTSEPGWVEFELPDSNNPTSMTASGHNYNVTLTRASSLGTLGRDGDYFWDSSSRTLYLRAVFTGTRNAFLRAGDFTGLMAEGHASWRIRR